MNWKKLGVVWAPTGKSPWAKTHAMGPTPFLLSPEVIRVFCTTLDAEGRGRPIYVDVDSNNPTNVISISESPLLDIGQPGAFDDNGLMVLSMVQMPANHLYMYYAGFEICTQIRYRIFTGLAESKDGGNTFQRLSQVPILDRSNSELYFRCGSFVLFDEGKFKLWYVGGDSWTEINGKKMPVYDLRYLESNDGITWSKSGQIVMPIVDNDEHGFGRPWLIKRSPNHYQLFYSIRRRSLSAYRLGYAESTDGINWLRKDSEMGLDVAQGEFDSDAIMYSAVITVGDKTYCFYNGNNFGEKGFAVAELVA
jgi:hypothetical protein